MIQQKAKGLNSRSEAIPYLEDGFLPLITAPMSSVVDHTNYQVFWESKINICFPRTADLDQVHNDPCYKDSFHAVSLDDFTTSFITNKNPIGSRPYKRCIDTANGNMPALHDAIKRAKEIHGDSLVIMAGNVSSVEAFVELAKTGCDYIRVGIGGGSGCNTTNNTGVGQEDLEKLVKSCKWHKKRHPTMGGQIQATSDELENISKVKIIADGISSYIKLCQQKYNFNDNGYAAIIKLLNSGADLVMIGGLFAQCVESAGEKGVKTLFNTQSFSDWQLERIQRGSFGSPTIDTPLDYMRIIKSGLEVKISGMSTVEEQRKYKEPTNLGTQDLSVPRLKPSEGSTKWVPVRWTLKEWLQGSDNQDEYPYLNGFVNSLKSAMSYTGSRTLNEFKS